MAKFRQLPEDFIVEEISDFDVKSSGKFKLYIVEKSGIESFYLISYISKKNNIHSQNIGVAGLKDKHAITKQYITIPSKYNIEETKESNLNITFVGFVDKEIKPGDLFGNKFVITVRDIKIGEIEGVTMKADTIKDLGVPNYFDSQRFGSVIHGEFIAKFIIKRDFESAVKIFLTSYQKSESKTTKDDKRLLLENWDDLSKLKVTTPVLKAVLDEYKKTGEFLFAYKKIPQNLRNMYVSAYQSYLWNECVKELIRQIEDKKKAYTIEYSCGTLLYYKTLNDEDKLKIPKSFQLIGPNMKMTELESKIINKLLTKEGLSLSDFDIKENTDNFFKPMSRDVIIYPTDFSISEPFLDELNDKGKKNHFKIMVSFGLPKGSYATVVTKRLFNQ